MAQKILQRAASFIALLVILGASSVIIIPLFPILLGYRLLVWMIVKIFRPDLESFVAGMKALFTSKNPEKAAVNILICFTIKGEITRERIQRIFQERVLNLKFEKGRLVYQRLQQSWTQFLGYSFWKNDQDFLLSNHVREYDYTGELGLPNPCYEDDLEVVLPKLAEAPWQKGRSSWEFLVVPNFSPSGKQQPHTLLIFRVDHIHCDAYSLIGLFRTLFHSPFATPKPSRNNWELSKWQRLGVLISMPFVMSNQVLMILKGRNTYIQRKASDCEGSYSKDVPVQTIKAIKQMHNVNFSSVVHAAVQGAVARGFRKAGKDPPKYNNMFEVLPLGNHPGGWHLHATMVLEGLPCASYTPKERLLQTDAILGKHDCVQAYASAYSAWLLALMPSPLVREVLRTIFFGTSSDMSNFPVTLGKDYVDGLEIVDVTAAVTSQEFLGLLVTSWGVNNRQRFHFYVNKALLGVDISAAQLATFFEEEVKSFQIMDDETAVVTLC